MTDLYRPPLVMSAPPKGRISAPDIFPNLLITTLLLVPIALPLSAGRADASAPAVKAPVQLDSFVKRPSQQLGINPTAFIQRLDAAAPQAKFYVEVDRGVWPITLGVVVTPPQVQSLYASAPSTKVDVAAFMAVATILPNPPAVHGLATPAPGPKKDVYDTNASTQRPVGLGLNPNAFIQRLDTGAPFPKYQVQVDRYPNLQTSTFAPAVATAPVGRPVDTSQLQLKYAVQVDPARYPLTLMPGKVAALVLSTSAPRSRFEVQVDVYPNLLSHLAGPVIPPLGKHIETMLPQLKYQTYPDRYPNLQENTLRPRELPIPLPLGLPHDYPLVQLTYQVQFDLYPNLLPLGISVILTPDQCKEIFEDYRPFEVRLPVRPFKVTARSRLFTVYWEC